MKKYNFASVAMFAAGTFFATPFFAAGTQNGLTEMRAAAAETTDFPGASAVSKVEGGTFDVLSRHDTNAVFAGTHEQVCMGRTMLCPDKCGGSGTVAVFKIERYNAYERNSKYGDGKAGDFAFMLEATTGESDVSPEIAAFVRSLAVGARVHLVWEHIYHTDPRGSKFPERVVRELSLLEPASEPEPETPSEAAPSSEPETPSEPDEKSSPSEPDKAVPAEKDE